jgi:type VI secretion system protein ImpA
MKTFQVSEDVWLGLLGPIPGENPTGLSLLYEPIYDEIKKARTHEDDSLPQGIWQRDLKRADWSQVEKLCINTLSTRTKDLQIAAWLSEAWLVQYGLQGLAKGLELSNLLTQNFWEPIHPAFNKDDPEYRLAPFNWINEKLEERLHFISLTQPSDVTEGPLTYADYTKAQQTDTQGRRDPKLAREHEKSGELSLTDFKRSQTLTPSPFYHDLYSQIETCLTHATTIENFITSKLPSFAGTLIRLRNTLKALLHFTQNALEERRESIAPLQENTHEDLPKRAWASPHGPIANREDAYQRLAEAADFLARLEPHSPTPYLVRRAISWGSMPLMDLMQEIVHDPNDYKQILQLLGLSRKSEHS